MPSRRKVLKSFGAAMLLAPTGPHILARAPKKNILVFTRSQGFQHDVVNVTKSNPCLVDRTMQNMAREHDFNVECTKDGRIFSPESIARFDAFFFFTTGDLTAEKSADGSPPMPKASKQALLDAIAKGKGFLGSHCASDTFHSPGESRRNQTPDKTDPYIQMLGGEFISHGEQQKSTMMVASPSFPGVAGVQEFPLVEEWYSLKNFAPNLHVILSQQTNGMKGADYSRPVYPATWARMHKKGRVFYTSMGHREDVWANPLFLKILAGGLDWATGRIDADVTPNLNQVAPEASAMPPAPPPKKK